MTVRSHYSNPSTLIRLPLGHADRVTIPSTGFEALLTLLRVNHCIDQPDATTNDDDRSKQEKDIRGAAVTLIIVFVKLLLFLRHLYAFLFQFLLLLCIFASSS